ncbi:ubiquitin fusion degradation protein-like protein 1 [Patellaria atrata CBS 101060]|uniref:Ubiquitin fusion degradation protein 1 n=1 Tax=Patellaria atrata CBS 101060 TaxID=1346257 RepID=A0A9P4SHG9_9PEZI|nr:ubiquitin fusion degradation protein-like protein 1 [Patellaria atrata CBS 101060]
MFSYNANYYDDDDHYRSMMHRSSRPPRRFDEYLRCYPIAMLPGPDRPSANHGGKVFMPPSALDKLTRLHITYPMLFELRNGKASKTTHAGVLEFIAEEGKIYLPYWLMQTLGLEPGDLVQILSTDLPLGSFIKLQPQDTSFLEISDPKAVLETAFRNFSCLTVGDIFTFAYNDNTYSVAVKDVKPANPANAICTIETDLSVDFEAPVGYDEEVARRKAASGTSTPRSATGGLAGQSGMMHPHGTMAAAINYAAIAPNSTAPGSGAQAVSSHFLSAGHKLNKKGSKTSTPQASTPVAGQSTNSPSEQIRTQVRRAGPQPLRLPPGKLFLGYEITPLRKKGEAAESEEKVHFQGQGNTLRKRKDGK